MGLPAVAQAASPASGSSDSERLVLEMSEWMFHGRPGESVAERQQRLAREAAADGGQGREAEADRRDEQPHAAGSAEDVQAAIFFTFVCGSFHSQAWSWLHDSEG